MRPDASGASFVSRDWEASDTSDDASGTKLVPRRARATVPDVGPVAPLEGFRLTNAKRALKPPSCEPEPLS